MVASAFDLGHPIESLTPHRYGSFETWILTTIAGRFLVKRLWLGPEPEWRAALERSMDFERRARQGGLDMPVAIVPPRPAFGCAALVGSYGIFRVYEWLDHRPVDLGDDLSEWVGATLARLHQVEPLAGSQPEPEWYGLHPPERWHDWLAAGEAQGRAWAPALRQAVPVILKTSRWIADAFANAGGYVLTHRDVEPWNVLITDRGPVLVDWDTSGPDSAPLEAAQALLTFATIGKAEPDPARVRRGLAAYVDAGGAPLTSGRDLTARRAGLKLARLSERLQVTVGRIGAGSTEPHKADIRAREQLEELPGFLADLTRWCALLEPGADPTFA